MEVDVSLKERSRHIYEYMYYLLTSMLRIDVFAEGKTKRTVVTSSLRTFMDCMSPMKVKRKAFFYVKFSNILTATDTT